MVPKKMLKRSFCAAAAMAILGATVPCAAQNALAPPGAAQGTPPQIRDPKACAPGQGARAGGDPPQSVGSAAPTLSDRLARTDGVICPPDIDPDIRAPTPQGGPMPVIPPPGSPGGDSSVQPR
jgi:hypothetical protein